MALLVMDSELETVRTTGAGPGKLSHTEKIQHKVCHHWFSAYWMMMMMDIK